MGDCVCCDQEDGDGEEVREAEVSTLAHPPELNERNRGRSRVLGGKREEFAQR